MWKTHYWQFCFVPTEHLDKSLAYFFRFPNKEHHALELFLASSNPVTVTHFSLEARTKINKTNGVWAQIHHDKSLLSQCHCTDSWRCPVTLLFMSIECIYNRANWSNRNKISILSVSYCGPHEYRMCHSFSVGVRPRSLVLIKMFCIFFILSLND